MTQLLLACLIELLSVAVRHPAMSVRQYGLLSVRNSGDRVTSQRTRTSGQTEACTRQTAHADVRDAIHSSRITSLLETAAFFESRMAVFATSLSRKPDAAAIFTYSTTFVTSFSAIHTWFLAKTRSTTAAIR
jgi:hypothetical protein